MSVRVSGVCVGGPLDGQMVSNDDTILCVDRDGNAISKTCGECGHERKLKPHELERKYRFIQIGDPGGFWLWHEMLISQGVNALAAAYNEKERTA